MSQFRIRILDQMSRLAEETGSAVVLVGGERRLPWNQDHHVRPFIMTNLIIMIIIRLV